MGSTSTQKEEGSYQMLKCCSICKTTKTPLWRSGPSGPKSLCNACGIKYRKKSSSSSSSSTSPAKKGKIGKTTRRGRGMKGFGVNLMVMPKQVELMDQEQQRIPRQQWGEVETAALLLMALSCGAVFA